MQILLEYTSMVPYSIFWDSEITSRSPEASDGSRRAVVSREAKKKQHAYASSGQCDHYSELFTRMVGGLNF